MSNCANIILTNIKKSNHEKTELIKVISYELYHPLNSKVEKAKADKFNEAGDKQYWSEGDFLIPNMNAMKENSIESLRESVEKELAAINKEAEHEIIASKLEKVQALIDKKQTQISRLDEDEDLKDLTDAKKVKEISKDIKSLEKAKAKLEKMMHKGKAKSPRKEVIDETDETIDEAENEEYIEDAEKRQDDGQKIPSILANYNNISAEKRREIGQGLEARKEI